MPLLQFQQMNVNLTNPWGLVNNLSGGTSVINIFKTPSDGLSPEFAPYS